MSEYIIHVAIELKRTCQPSICIGLYCRWIAMSTYSNLFPTSTFSHFNLGNLGVPIKLLFEAEGMKVTAEVCYTRPLFCVFL